MFSYRSLIPACLFAALLAGGAARAQSVAWTAPIEAYTQVSAAVHKVATASNGDTAMLVEAGGSRYQLRVALYAGAAPAWQATFPADCLPSRDSGYAADAAIAFGPDGDVYAAANSGYGQAACVMRLARADGRMVWRHRQADADQLSLRGFGALAFGAQGDLYAASSAGESVVIRVTRLDTATGAVQWQREPEAGAGRRHVRAYALATDAAGAAYLASAYEAIAPALIGGVSVTRIDATGVATWTRPLPGRQGVDDRCEGIESPSLLVLPDGAAIASGSCRDPYPIGAAGDRHFIHKVRTIDGAVAWSRESAGEKLHTLQAGQAGEIVATGQFESSAKTLRRFDASTGATLWTSGPPWYATLQIAGSGQALVAAASYAASKITISTAPVDLSNGAMGPLTLRVDAAYPLNWLLAGDGSGRTSLVAAATRPSPIPWGQTQTIEVTAFTGTTTTATSTGITRSTHYALFPTPWRRALAFSGDGVVSIANLPEGDFYSADGAIIVKRDTATGRERWRRTYDRDSQETTWVKGIAALPGGDIVFNGANDMLTRLDGATGETRWRRSRPDAFYQLDALVADAAGDLLVLVHGPDKNYAVKFAGADGSERWRVELPVGGFYATEKGQLRIASNGDALVMSFGNDAQGQPHYYAARLRGGDGGQVWRTEFDAALPGVQPFDAVVAGGNDLVVAGNRAERGWAARLDGADGHVRWSVDHAGLQTVYRALVDAGGSIVLAGGYDRSPSGNGWRMARLAAADGAVQWFRELPLHPTEGGIYEVAQAPDGTLLFSGECEGFEALCIAGLAQDDGTDRWWYSQSLPVYGLPDMLAQDMAFDARGNLIVNTYVRTNATPDDGATATQLRIVGPWADDLFANGFE